MKKATGSDCDCHECPAEKKLWRKLLVIVIIMLVAYVSLEIYFR